MTADIGFNPELSKSVETPARIHALPGFNPDNMSFLLDMELAEARRDVARRIATGETYDLHQLEARVRRTIVGPLHALEIASGRELTDTSDFDIVMPDEGEFEPVDTSLPELWVQ